MPQAQTIVTVQGAGLFPLHALVQSDGFFASAEDSRTARGRITRTLRAQVPTEQIEGFRKKLQPEGWDIIEGA